jgi:hypothetical protein
MNLLNIVKHLLHLVQTEYESDDSATTADEIFAVERLFEILKSLKTAFSMSCILMMLSNLKMNLMK